MPIGRALYNGELAEKNWRAFMSLAGLDEGRVWDLTAGVMSGVAEYFREVFADAGADHAQLSILEQNVRKLPR